MAYSTTVNSKTGKSDAQVIASSNAAVAKAKSVLAQTKAEGSKSYAGSSYEKKYNESVAPISAVDLGTKTTPADIPTYTAPTVAAPTLMAAEGYTIDPKTGLYTADTVNGNLGQLQNERLTTINNLFNSQPTGEDTLAQIEKDAQLKKKQQAVNNYTSQINAIQASSQAQQLALEGQGRGQTTGFIGGEQARINREAAIAALPIQAQLASAQGDLQMAQEHVDKMFQIKMADQQAKYQFNSSLINAVYDFADASEQRRLNAIADQQKQDHADKQSNINYARQLALQAVEYGQTSLATRIGQIDWNSPTANDDLARLTGQLSKPAVVTKRDTAFNASGDLIDMQTGETITKGAGTGTGTIDGKPQTAAQALSTGYANRLLEAERTLSVVNDKFAGGLAYGNLLPNQLQSAERQQFEQAKRNFINAKLRKESGAVIADSEFESADQQYFAQPGDTPEVLKQKAQNRNMVINDLYREANIPRPVYAGDTIVSEGKTYRVAPNGEDLIEIGSDGKEVKPVVWGLQ